jgi:hypothetical protein
LRDDSFSKNAAIEVGVTTIEQFLEARDGAMSWRTPPSRLHHAAAAEEPDGSAPYRTEHAEDHGWTDEFMSRRGNLLDDVTGMWLPATTIVKRLSAQNEKYKEALAQSTREEFSMARRLRSAIVEARRRLAKGRGLWNGPCHECDGVLADALSDAPKEGR